MDRRKFLLGVGSASLGGAALVGSGAFSRVESHRDVAIQVATDENAYLGLKPLDTPNSNNYVELDGDGHLAIDIAEHDDFDGPDTQPGEGVNSDSFTWFDGMFELCNQGKEGACLSYALPDGVVANDVDEQTVSFYYVERDSDGGVTNRRIVDENEEILLELGECAEMGVRTVTKGVDSANTPLIDGEVTVTADVDGDCFDVGDPGAPDCVECTASAGDGSEDFLALENIDTSSYPDIEATTRIETDAGQNGNLDESDFTVCESFGGEDFGQTPTVTFAGEDEEAEADVMITLDTSGSMSGTKLDNAKDGAKTLVDNLGPGVNVGLVNFDDSGQIVEYNGQDMILGTDQSTIKDAIGSLSAGGTTNMSDGIDVSQQEIDDNGDDTTPDFMIVLANGGADSDPDTLQAARDARNVNNLNDEGDGTTIISIAYGSGADEDLMEDISSPPKVDDGVIDDNDENAFVGETDDISQVFEDIGQIISGTYRIEYTTCNPETDGTDRDVLVYVDDPNEGDADDTGSYTAPSS